MAFMSKRPVQADGRVHGCIVAAQNQDGKWLLIRRAKGVAMAGGICFPGGAIEHGETHEQAGIREIREETGLVVTLDKEVWHFEYPDRPLTLWGWLGQLQTFNPAPDPNEVSEILWLNFDEITSNPDVLPYTDLFIEQIKANLPTTV
ncbi:MAG TPA: hypothetical protein DCM28_18585 [Phycisphaerales bacterium]|nr:hypothetical protein [Phycisphaerales bacterium]|tara:strand:- start:379 stop:819 length:441 start_codon:yes stop_codon:yes gene_type:complete